MQQTAISRTAPTGRAHSQPPYRASAFWRMLPAGMRRRWWLFRVFDLIARHWPVLGKRKGLLVVRMDGIGDMVLFRRALDHYAEAFGVAPHDITVLGCTSWASIAGPIFDPFRVIAIDEHAFARRPLYRFGIALKVRLLAPAIAVCDSYFRRALMADSLVWFAAAPRSVVSLPYVNEPTRAEFTYFLSQIDELIDTGAYPVHEIERHYRFLSAVAGRDIRPEPPVISWPERPSPVPAGVPYLVLNAGSNEPGRRWPSSGYRRIAERALAAGFRVVLVGNDAERPPAGEFDRLAQQPGMIDLIGRTSLAQVLDVMKHAAAVLSNDSGPAHLSIALGVPTVVIVGGGHFGSFVPYPETVRPPTARFVHHAVDCYHCFWRCPLRAAKTDPFPCVAGVNEDAVWQALADLVPAFAEKSAPDPAAHGSAP